MIPFWVATLNSNLLQLIARCGSHNVTQGREYCCLDCLLRSKSEPSDKWPMSNSLLIWFFYYCNLNCRNLTLAEVARAMRWISVRSFLVSTPSGMQFRFRQRCGPKFCAHRQNNHQIVSPTPLVCHLPKWHWESSHIACDIVEYVILHTITSETFQNSLGLKYAVTSVSNKYLQWPEFSSSSSEGNSNSLPGRINRNMSLYLFPSG